LTIQRPAGFARGSLRSTITPVPDDLYAILGVPRSASADDIKKAYRAQARKNHPDVNKAPDAAKAFSKIQNAYDILSDEPKRKLYDQYGEDGVKNGGAWPGGPGGVWNSSRPPRGAGGTTGSHFNFDMEDLSSMFDTFFGCSSRAGAASAGSAKRGARKPKNAPPAPSPHDVHVSFLRAARGGSEPIRVSTGGFSRQVDLSIPPGVPHGAVLRLRGMGALNEDGVPDDLLVRVHIDPHELFRRGEGADAGRSLDLFVDIPLTVAEATFGAAVNVPTLSGQVEVKIPAGTHSGKKLRLRGMGIKPDSGTAGDLYAVIQIVPPSDMSKPDRAVLESILGKQPSPRQGAAWT